jgi:hypothetical protein
MLTASPVWAVLISAILSISLSILLKCFLVLQITIHFFFFPWLAVSAGFAWYFMFCVLHWYCLLCLLTPSNLQPSIQLSSFTCWYSLTWASFNLLYSFSFTLSLLLFLFYLQSDYFIISNSHAFPPVTPFKHVWKHIWKCVWKHTSTNPIQFAPSKKTMCCSGYYLYCHQCLCLCR